MLIDQEPLTPADCNLRGFGWMPLDVQRLLDSDLFVLSTGDEFKAAVALWAKAWAQVPAASLPNDDRMLAHFSGAGANWPAVRDMALRGFVLCSDGRLYHRVLAEKAIDAWQQREKTRIKQRKWREGKALRSVDGDETVTLPSRDPSRDHNVTDERTGEERDSTGEDLLCNSKQPLSPDKSGARAEPRADRGSRLPVDWLPSAEDRAFAAAEGIDPDREAASFRDYWTSKPGAAGRKSNWSATWRNWVRRSAERNSTGGNRNGHGSRHRNGFIVLAEKRARADRERAAGGTIVDLIEDDDRSQRSGDWRGTGA